MIFGLTTFTLIHTVLSLVGIFAGFVGTVLALYLNVFVLVVQLFTRLPALIAAAPTQKEPPFLVTQLLVVALFVWLGRAALKGFPTGSATPGTA